MLQLDNVDRHALEELFKEHDGDNDGMINIDELENILVKFGVAPLVDPSKKVSSLEKKPDAENNESK